MSNQFFQASRMESQFVETDLISVIFQSAGVDASVTDGTLAVLSGFYNESVYTSAFGVNTLDINTRIATVTATPTIAGVGVIDLAVVPTATGMGNTYRLGTQTIGLTADAGVPVRFRKFMLDDSFFTGGDNFSSAPTVGQYAIVGASGNWVPSATQPATGLVAKVEKSGALTQGIDPSVTQYFLRIVQLQ